MSGLDKLDPSILWKHFSEICSIPHSSKHEAAITEYVKHFADSHGLSYVVDNAGNICVSKCASRGKENSEGVILQGHLDMVPQKNDATAHDFLTDPIVPVIEGDWIRATDTTLGADNGIGIATMLAILESGNLQHPQLQALFTIDEETGMSGALGLENSLLKGSRLINLDTEDDNMLIIGCAGGLDCSASFSYQQEAADNNTASFTITLYGLKGGHSGIDINLGRGNAIKLLNRILYSCAQKTDLRISSIKGGSVRNAIPREASAVITVPVSEIKILKESASLIEKELKNELYGSETSIIVEITHAEHPHKVMSRESQKSLLRAIYACPNGVIRQSSRVNDVVETSSNMAIISCGSGNASVHCLLRSSIETAINDLRVAIESALSLGGFSVSFTGGYPGWEPDPDSGLLKNMMNVYETLFGDLPEVKVVHAGLECGIIGSKYPDMQMVSCGPTIRHPHSPEERVSISSVKRFWNYITKVLEVI